MTRRLATLLLVACSGCIFFVLQEGDPCDLDDDTCPEAFVCERDDAGEARCHVRIGGACDGALGPTGTLCADGTSCSGVGADASCGGVGSTCEQGLCADGLVCAPPNGDPLEAICAPPG